INLGEDSVLGFHLVGILAFSLSTQIFFFLATLVLSGFDPLVSVSQLSFSTTGDTKLIYLGEFYDNFYDFISPYLSDIPFDFIDVFKKRYTATP
ncbi:hypothetical protein PN446_18890, partial [Microcystis aeruginosa CS-567/02]|nr:hypothetical protein [Microcystis aeruginosa CS-567/02]